MTDLFDPEEEDWVEFQNNTQEYYLRVASNAIRKYLGWHLSPSVTETIVVPIGQRGIIPLPSRYVTNVSRVEIAETVMDADGYTWDKAGWIQTGRYYYDPSSAWPTVASWQDHNATVTLTHGYAEVPLEVKQVGFELAQDAMSTPVSNVSQMSTPAGYRITLSSPPGFYLSVGQQQVLAPYRLFGAT
jgi:hypothetical protein